MISSQSTKACAFSALFLAAVLLTPAPAANWPAWRGDAAGSGITPEKTLPLKWSATENVRWKTPLPERGNSTPIVWENRVFITQAVGEQRLVICFDRQDGRELWRSGTSYSAREETHPTNSYCSASPVTDGERVVAWFGSAGLFCFDFAGKEQWRLELGAQEHEWGYSTSPVLHKNLCIQYFGPGPNSFLLAVDKATGKEAWRVAVPEQPGGKDRTDGFAGREGGTVGSFSTPIVIQANGRDELVMAFPGHVRAFDPQSGRELWRCAGLTPLLYASPMHGEGIVVAMAGFSGSELGVRAGGSGDVTASARLWHHARTKLRLGSGVIHAGHLYILNTPGVAQCLNLKTGESVWEQRLQGPSSRSESWSSMVLSGDRIYILNQAGDTFIIRASPTFEQLAVNAIGDGLTNSSHAISDGQIFIRTHKHLWCIGK